MNDITAVDCFTSSPPCYDNEPNFTIFNCSEIVGEVQLRKYGRFLEDYATQLQEIEQALEESLADAWDITLDPISLQVGLLR